METVLQWFAAVLAIISRRLRACRSLQEQAKNSTKLLKSRAKPGKAAKNSREEQGWLTGAETGKAGNSRCGVHPLAELRVKQILSDSKFFRREAARWGEAIRSAKIELQE
jgi:hypothetical protein